MKIFGNFGGEDGSRADSIWVVVEIYVVGLGVGFSSGIVEGILLVEFVIAVNFVILKEGTCDFSLFKLGNFSTNFDRTRGEERGEGG